MPKREMTKRLERAIYNETVKMGVYGCHEVTIGYFGKERVDYMTYNTKGEFRCYEVKVSLSDFHSKNHNTWVGHYNYYVMPFDLYKKVKDEIPVGIGVYTSSNGDFVRCIVKAKRREPAVEIEILKNSLIRSLARGNDKLFKSGDRTCIDRKDARIKKLQSDVRNKERMYWAMVEKYHANRRHNDERV